MQMVQKNGIKIMSLLDFLKIDFFKSLKHVN
jgi:hypothetical protein